MTVDEDPDLPSYRLVLGLGIVSVCFGLVMLLWPDLTVRAYAVFAGIWLLLMGVTRIADAFRQQPGPGRRLLSGTVGIVLFVAGAACLRDVAKGVAVLGFIVAVAFLLGGVAWWVMAGRRTGSMRRWLIALALVSFVVGLGFLAWPEASLGILVWFSGLAALATGLAEIAFSRALTRAAAAAVAAPRPHP
jgi:uncharacterized membrane protein HdeD (DUF308 family)